MSRVLAPALLLLASGCPLPELPEAPGADGDTTDGTATVGVSDGMTMGATDTSADTETTSPDDDDDDDDDDETDTGTDTGTDTDTTGEPVDCGAIDPFVIDGHAASNCRIGVDFELTTARTLTELRAPQGSGENLLFDGASSFLEEYSGIIQWPSYTSADATEPMIKLGEHFVAQEGPAVFRIWIPWIVDQGGGSGFEGTSIYTVLADGRIFRDESVHVFEEVGDWVVAYLALRSDALPVAYWGGAQSGSYTAPVPGNGEQDSFFEANSEPAPDNDAYTCAHDSASGDTVGFTQYEGTYTIWAGPRATFVQATAGITETSAFVLQADWLRTTTIGPGQLGFYNGEIMMHVDADTSGAPCAAMASYYEAYRDSGYLEVTSGGAADLPELFGDENEGDTFSHGGGFYYLRSIGADDIVLTIQGSGTTQPTMLLYVAGLTPEDVTGVSIGGTSLSEGEYLVQGANAEGSGTSMGGLDVGAFVLIGVPVAPGAEVVVSR